MFAGGYVCRWQSEYATIPSHLLIAGYMRRFGGIGLEYYIFTLVISLSRASLQPCRGENQIPCVKDSIPLCWIRYAG